MLINFREKGREGEREIQTSMGERNIDQLPLRALTRDWTRNHMGVLTGNRTRDLLADMTALQPTEPHLPGLELLLDGRQSSGRVLSLFLIFLFGSVMFFNITFQLSALTFNMVHFTSQIHWSVFVAITVNLFSPCWGHFSLSAAFM